jgi:hypothetical protein
MPAQQQREARQTRPLGVVVVTDDPADQQRSGERELHDVDRVGCACFFDLCVHISWRIRDSLNFVLHQ